jgi:hypothetical protein
VKPLGEIDFDISQMVGGVTINKTFQLNKALPNSHINLEISITKHEETAADLASGDPKHIVESSDEDERFDVNSSSQVGQPDENSSTSIQCSTVEMLIANDEDLALMNSIAGQAEKEKNYYNGTGGRDIIDGHIKSEEPIKKLPDY